MVVSDAFENMVWFEWIALCSLVVSLSAALLQCIWLIRLGKPKDMAPPAGKVSPAVLYAMTGAMNPAKKESAYLHLPTYVAGILYHMGTFLSIPLFLLMWLYIPISGVMVIIMSSILSVTAACGVGILVKRAMKKELRELSSPDDYISNSLVTLFQVGTLLTLSIPKILPAYFILTSILFLYLPLSKLKHVIYFFAARYHLGFFYGWRGVWPPGKRV